MKEQNRGILRTIGALVIGMPLGGLWVHNNPEYSSLLIGTVVFLVGLGIWCAGEFYKRNKLKWE